MGAYSGTKEAMQAVNDKLRQIDELYKECEKIAIEHNVNFTYSGPAGYGDGGYFYPKGEEDNYGEMTNWHASSQSC